MLRITRIPRPDAPTLRLEGKLLGPWVDEVRRTCRDGEAGAGPGRPLTRLDLSDLTYTDADGIALLRELVAGGAEIAACSPFVADLLNVETP